MSHACTSFDKQIPCLGLSPFMQTILAVVFSITWPYFCLGLFGVCIMSCWGQILLMHYSPPSTALTWLCLCRYQLQCRPPLMTPIPQSITWLQGNRLPMGFYSDFSSNFYSILSLDTPRGPVIQKLLN